MKKIIIVLSALLYIFTIPVFASEEDILKEPIKEEEEIEDDKNILKSTGHINNTRSSVSDPTQARQILFGIRAASNFWSDSMPTNNLSLGTKYRIRITQNTPNPINNYVGAVGYPDIGYFVRGEEVLNSTFNWYYNDSIIDGKITEFENNSLDYSPIESILYIEPIPEPTPTPEPDEPKVDPETISGNEILREILKTNREINENVKGIYKYISNNSVSDSVLSDNSVSDNIIYKRLEDYSTSESLALIGLVLAFGALLIYLIHKTVFRIRR